MNSGTKHKTVWIQNLTSSHACAFGIGATLVIVKNPMALLFQERSSYEVMAGGMIHWKMYALFKIMM